MPASSSLAPRHQAPITCICPPSVSAARLLIARCCVVMTSVLQLVIKRPFHRALPNQLPSRVSLSIMSIRLMCFLYQIGTVILYPSASRAEFRSLGTWGHVLVPQPPLLYCHDFATFPMRSRWSIFWERRQCNENSGYSSNTGCVSLMNCCPTRCETCG
ncbi:uncharacterized protein EI90DRAFT_3068602 [Cantharellus anzutake]|uniref:uncharacterized protein n=1 Tax=Cantharellus anzutake TaxID=1750568 RepID=UPI001904D115|nr:uncharacterized protein EI90DRAFT_3068602 [Cantharellus anzutake]KAF8327294.1 hypothetical protein EI90DRAFT_3068602 [Cantharellus anzutake]